MKTTRLLITVIATSFVVCGFAQTPLPRLTDRSKSGLLKYFQDVIKNNQVIVGQHCSETTDMATNYQKAFQSLYDATGKYPALLGLDYGYFANVNYAETNQFALAHWKKGGLVTINWSADNPWKDGYNCRWNSIQKKDSIDLRKLLKNAPASKEKDNYRKELLKVANALQQLKEAGVIVLWRPLHEVNGNWFWWCVNDSKAPTNQPGIAALWKDMYQTLTIDYKLDNLLWVYSPNASSEWIPPVYSMYPGDELVDLVGTDVYPAKPVFADYNALKHKNKVIVNGEIGPSKESYGSFDEMAVLNTFKGKAAYFLQWHSWINAKVAIVDNLNFKEMMHDPAAITLDKLK